MDKSERMRIRFEAIQELKREKYIGTKQAWNYLERMAALRANPSRVADAINIALRQELGIADLIYEATPERIVGIAHALDVLDKDAADLETDIFNKSGVKEDDQKSYHSGDATFRRANHPLKKWGELLTGFRGAKPSPEVLINYFLPIFRKMQHEEGDNASFAHSTFKRYIQDTSPTLEFAYALASLTSQMDWNLVLSTEMLGSIDSIKRADIFGSEIPIERRIDLMQNDLVDHRIENQREIIEDWTMENSITTYEEAFATVENRLITRKERLEELVQANASEIQISQERRMIQRAEFLYKALVQNKNFVIKYLKN